MGWGLGTGPLPHCKMAQWQKMRSFLEVWKRSVSNTGVRFYGTRQESKPWKQKPNRNPRLKIILTEAVHNLGSKGQIVKVKRGYGRNYLLPRRMAVYGTPDNIKQYDAFEVVKGSKTGVNEIEFLTNFLTDKVVTITQDPSRHWDIFEQTISSALKKQHQVHVPLDCIQLKNPMTSFGKHAVDVRLDASTSVSVSINVVPETPKKQKKEQT